MVPARAAIRWRRWSRWLVRRAHFRMVDSWRATSNLLLPPFCVVCGAELDGPPCLCGCCHRLLWDRETRLCGRCASPLPAGWGDPTGCPRCQDRHYAFDRATALGAYEGERRNVVLCMKRAAFEPMTRTVARLLAEQVDAARPVWHADLVLVPPMHWWRRLQRGTHTARVLGGEIAHRLRVRFAPQLLRSVRKTKKQGTLSPAERRQNVRGAYRLREARQVAGKDVLVVDDVMTTGATLHEIARLLRRAGAATVSVAVVARGVGQ